MKRPFLVLTAALWGLVILILFCACQTDPSTQADATASLPPLSRPASSSSSAASSRPPESSALPSSAPAATTAVPTTTAPPSTVPPSTRDLSGTVFLNEEERLALDTLLASYPGQLSLSYLSLENGESYVYRDDVLYYAASLVKAPYALYLLRLADSGACDLDQELVLLDKWKQEGTGTLKNEPEGSLYTVKDLIRLMITISDNTAFKVLREEYPLWEYNQFCRKELDVHNTTYQDITAEDMTKCMAAIYSYIETGSENALFLRDLMSQAVSPFIKAPGADLLIHKHGWADPAFNDMAIVYEEHPYLLVLLSDHCDGTWEDVKMFSDISRTVKAFHDKKEEPPPLSSAPPESTAALSQ